MDVNEGVIEKWDEIFGLNVNEGIKLGDSEIITLGLGDRRNLGSLDGSFDGSNDGNIEGFGTITNG